MSGLGICSARSGAAVLWGADARQPEMALPGHGARRQRGNRVFAGPGSMNNATECCVVPNEAPTTWKKVTPDVADAEVRKTTCSAR